MSLIQKAALLCRPVCELCGKERSFSTKTKLFNKITVCVEGNIGCGKTTFLKQFQKFDKLVETNGEPVQRWRDFGGQNPLAHLYADPARWALSFQSLVLLTLLERHTQPQVKPVRMLERSIYSARYCFTENLKQGGLLSDIEYIILTQWFDYVTSRNDVTVDLVVYLRTSPELCYERIKARNRYEEQKVSMDYLQKLHDLHEKWLLDTENTSVIRPPVLVVNGDNDIQTIKNRLHSIQAQIFSYLKQPVYR
ncbi:thymidine kinase 2, mitochondrial-like [Mercenaria mercenaria]|uniref:thymidine kinase 2, mitochondrial-like n=1 Tax=Mercenaria mercenaria TaxID=6596 RepID=UPI00234F59C0|nr:thymidine kinase 2, mitochondrial-like [Mercenaria mercenaria]